MDLSKYVDLFLSEGREHVAELNGALAEMEHAPSSDEAIAAAFRAVHSIKGMAAAMGYAAVTARADTLETTLDAVRRGDAVVTASLLGSLLDEADALAAEIELAVTTPAPGPEAVSDHGAAAPIERQLAPPPRRASHVRIRASRLDSLMNLVGEIEIARGRLERELRRAPDEGISSAFASTSRLLGELREQVIGARIVPVARKSVV